MPKDTPKDKDELMQLYSLYSRTAENTSDRRLKSNQAYLTLCSSLVAVLAVTQWSGQAHWLSFIIVGLLGLVLCGLWGANINSYKKLNEAKFKIILELEEHFSVACYTKEWHLLTEGKGGKKYRLLTSIEKGMPLLFGILFSAILLIGIWGYA